MLHRSDNQEHKTHKKQPFGHKKCINFLLQYRYLFAISIICSAILGHNQQHDPVRCALYILQSENYFPLYLSRGATVH